MRINRISFAGWMAALAHFLIMLIGLLMMMVGIIGLSDSADPLVSTICLVAGFLLVVVMGTEMVTIIKEEKELNVKAYKEATDRKSSPRVHRKG